MADTTTAILRAPWNAAWTAEERYEIRPCRYAGGTLAMWQPFKPGQGAPIFAKPHFVRQRKSIAEHRCTVCGEKTAPGDRWTFGHGEWRDGYWMTQEAPVHLECAEIAMKHCPMIKAKSMTPFRWPSGATIVASIVGGPVFERDFGITLSGRRVIGALKFAWPTLPASPLRDEAQACRQANAPRQGDVSACPRFRQRWRLRWSLARRLQHRSRQSRGRHIPKPRRRPRQTTAASPPTSPAGPHQTLR